MWSLGSTYTRDSDFVAWGQAWESAYEPLSQDVHVCCQQITLPPENAPGPKLIKKYRLLLLQ